MKNFWMELKKPFFVLAPMDDVTDIVFRRIVAMLAKPDVIFTEFTNVDGLLSKGRDKLMPRLWFDKSEHPIVAQIWGLQPENYFKAAREIRDLGFDGIDINMGCPDRKVTRNGACSALINNHSLAKEIILATKEGAGDIPVSVKTRLGFKTLQTEEWVSFLLTLNLAALTMHGRLAKDMSKVPANWEEIAKVVKIRDEMNKPTLIVGNGDVENYQDGIEKSKKYGVDGVMIGRGIFKDTWVFDPKIHDHTAEEKLQLLLEHTRLFMEVWQGNKNINILKKFFKTYANGFDNASDLRMELMEAKSASEIETIVRNFQNTYLGNC